MMGPGGVRKTTQESLKQEKFLKYTQVDAGRQTLKNCVFQSFFFFYLCMEENKVDIFICWILFHHNKFYLVGFQTNLARKQLQKY